MGLDVYAGPLCRYYSGNWQTIVQQYGESTGLTVNIVRPRTTAVRRILNLLSALIPARRIDPVMLVSAWRQNLAARHTATDPTEWDWPESLELPFQTDKPGFDGYGALQLWASYVDQEAGSPPEDFPADWAADPAVLDANPAPRRFRHLSGPELWLPVHFPDVITAVEPNGHKPSIGSVFSLWAELQELNEATWSADENAIHSWRRDDWNPEKLESTARWAFSIWFGLTQFAVMNRSPIRLDY